MKWSFQCSASPFLCRSESLALEKDAFETIFRSSFLLSSLRRLSCSPLSCSLLLLWGLTYTCLRCPICIANELGILLERVRPSSPKEKENRYIGRKIKKRLFQKNLRRMGFPIIKSTSNSLCCITTYGHDLGAQSIQVTAFYTCS